MRACEPFIHTAATVNTKLRQHSAMNLKWDGYKREIIGTRASQVYYRHASAYEISAQCLHRGAYVKKLNWVDLKRY